MKSISGGVCECHIFINAMLRLEHLYSCIPLSKLRKYTMPASIYPSLDRINMYICVHIKKGIFHNEERRAKTTVGARVRARSSDIEFGFFGVFLFGFGARLVVIEPWPL